MMHKSITRNPRESEMGIKSFKRMDEGSSEGWCVVFKHNNVESGPHDSKESAEAKRGSMIGNNASQYNYDNLQVLHGTRELGTDKFIQTKALTEGPMDFVRGAGAATGQKIAQSGLARGVRDVVQAGQAASAVGDFNNMVVQFAKALALYDSLKNQRPQERQEPTMDPKPQAPAPQQQKPESAAPEAFRTTQKPKGQMGPQGFQYTFNSFLQDTHGEQINEGVWDFVKGAGAAVGSKIRDKINQYGQKASTITDIYRAGVQASREGDQRRQGQKAEQAKQQALELLQQLVDKLKGFGDKAPQVLANAVAKLPQPQQQRVYKTLARNSGIRT